MNPDNWEPSGPRISGPSEGEWQAWEKKMKRTNSKGVEAAAGLAIEAVGFLGSAVKFAHEAGITENTCTKLVHTLYRTLNGPGKKVGKPKNRAKTST